jgi:multidrug resistance efflux pump
MAPTVIDRDPSASTTPRSPTPASPALSGAQGKAPAQPGAPGIGTAVQTGAGVGPAQALACLQAALAEQQWQACTAALVNELSRCLGASRVSLGWQSGDTLDIVALSGGATLEEGAFIPDLHQAMLEAAHQHATLVWPPTPEMDAHITLAHQALFKTQGLCGALSVPLAHQGQLVGVLLCERTTYGEGPSTPAQALTRPQRAGFTEAQQRWLVSSADALAAALAWRHDIDRSWLARSQDQWRALRRRLADPSQRLLRWGLLGAAALLLALAAWPWPHQVTAQARLEGSVQRVLSAPQDGFLREVKVRPGEHVKAGQVLAQMADEDLQSARRGHLAEIAQRENEFADAFARGDRAQAMTAQNQLAAAKAQLALVDQQLGRLSIVAPFDGIVIQGDLRQQLGAPLKRGETLLTMAPGYDWRVVLEVPEADIAQLAESQPAALRLAAMPEHTIGLALSHITPVAKVTPQGVRYEIEARPNGAGAGLPGLRPGLQGVARIDLPPQPLLWRAAVASWQWLRMATWTWL